MPEIDALAFQPARQLSGLGGLCFVHRLAFRALLAMRDPTPDVCCAFYRRHTAVFERAAQHKKQTHRLVEDARFHLTSRDLRRAFG